ncbi:MAG TPA: hypothetical protein VFM10_00925 [Terriglobales bacterium]|jgi:hypothetical protein|nr:hypothetical protein [Terriglobales bacterium]
MNTGRRDPVVTVQGRSTEPTYEVRGGLEGDVFPVFANYASFQRPTERETGTVTVTVTNSTDSLVRNRVAVQVQGWSDQEIQVTEIAAGQVRKLLFAPTFRARLYQNREITAATALVSVTDMGGHEVFSTTVPLRLRSADDIYWGANFEYAQFIASWVTPHDPRVEAVLSRAKELMPGRRLPGYETWRAPGVQEKTTLAQVKAIYRALQRKGVSYVKSSSTMGAHVNADVTERVRMPHESLGHVSANCIDGVVLYASLFENLGMDPVIVLVPGHAYVGVRLAQDSTQFLYVETAVTGRLPFEVAVKSATAGMAKYSESQIIRIPITQAREAGIYPMPASSKEAQSASVDAREANQNSLP